MKLFNEVLHKVNKYTEIVIYRHINPDFDAFGSQLGLYTILSKTFVNKNIYVAGEFTSDLVGKFDVEVNTAVLPDFTSEKVLGIVVDTANHERIDGESYKQCTEIVKIDHHIAVDDFGNINVVDETASSASQLIAQFLMDKNDILKINPAGASALYMGMIGDTNRFMYKTTDERTFRLAAMLVETGIDIDALYQRMYLRKAKDLQIHAFILNQFKVCGNIAYYVLKQKDLETLSITRERGSDYVNILSGIEEFEVWLAVTENVEEQNWRVSIRSRAVEIQEIAKKYHGGGHALASGATLTSFAELEMLLADLKQHINATVKNNNQVR